jgi:hypothetical protein
MIDQALVASHGQGIAVMRREKASHADRVFAQNCLSATEEAAIGDGRLQELSAKGDVVERLIELVDFELFRPLT